MWIPFYLSLSANKIVDDFLDILIIQARLHSIQANNSILLKRQSSAKYTTIWDAVYLSKKNRFKKALQR